jgi:hypothetical protein
MMITQNVTVLPSLRLDQWQAIFDIISTAAMCGPYAAIKSFEVLSLSFCSFLDNDAIPSAWLGWCTNPDYVRKYLYSVYKQ